MKKRIVVIVIVVLLLVVGLAAAWILWQRSQGKVIPIFGSKSERARSGQADVDYEGEFELEESGIYRVLLDDDTLFVQVEEMSGSRISGQYFTLLEGSDCLTAHSFEFATRWFSCYLTLEGEREYQIDVPGHKLEDYLNGEHFIVPETKGPSHRFAIVPYQAPNYHSIRDQQFKEPIFKVESHLDVLFGRAQGFWTSLMSDEEAGYGKMVRQGLKSSLKRRELDLTMDVYTPVRNSKNSQDSVVDVNYPAPVIVFLHGGAFYVGDKREQHIVGWCRHFASLGYVTASVNYRMGFMPTKKEIQRTGYNAVEDLQNAVRYLKAHAEAYHIDTNMFFVAGTSAGSITALDAAFQPHSDVRFKAVANMWGAVADLECLGNSRTSIVSFHGDADHLVPFEEGFPFSDLAKGRVGKALFNKMYGSKAINQRAQSEGLRTKFYVFPNAGHALHLNADKTLNQHNYNFIQDSTASFFYHELVPHQARIEHDRFDSRHYFVDNDNVDWVMWNVEGGLVVRQGTHEIWVVWFPAINGEPEPARQVEVSGYYKNGIGFNIKYF